MSDVDWARLDSAAETSIDRRAVTAAADAGIARGLRSSLLRLVGRRVLATVAVLLVTAAAFVVRGIVHAAPTSPSDADAIPAVLALTPDRGSTAGGDTVTITGNDLDGVTSVLFGAVAAPAVQVDSPTQLTATTPPAAPGPVVVTVTSPAGNSAAEGPEFLYLAVPVVLSISPARGSTEGGEEVTITGTGLTDVVSVRFGAAEAVAFTIDSDTSITATTPPAAPGIVDVVLSSGAATSGPGQGRFTFVEDPVVPESLPVVLAVDPASGPAAGGDTVSVTGTGFTNATGVLFGEQRALQFTAQSDTLITAIAPPGDPGTVEVRITAPSGTSEPAEEGRYTYVGTPPAVTGLSPTSECTNVRGDESVTITGTDLGDATQVWFGDLPAEGFTTQSETSIVAQAPQDAEDGVVDVTVTTPSGRSPTGPAASFLHLSCVD